MRIIDATDLVAGRLASYVSKLAMNGETIRIVNSEKAIISGNRTSLIKLFTDRIHKGNALAGPFYPKRADRILKRIIRGMLPYKKTNGLKAFNRIRTYLGVPDEFKDKIEKVDSLNLMNTNIKKYVTLKDLSKQLGGIQ